MMEVMSDETSLNESGGRSRFIFLPVTVRCLQTILLAGLMWVLLFLVAPKVSAQGTLRYDLIDLVDTTPGQDLWEYSYFLSGFTFQTNEGFSIFFDYQTYANLTNARPSLNPSWNMLAVQPDVALRADGFLDGLALVNSPSYMGPFRVTVTWKGQGTPGTQSFYTYNSNFTPTFTGQTTSVPEARSILLMGLGFLFLVGRRALGLRKNRPSS